MTKYVSKQNLEQYDSILKSYLGNTLDNIISEKVIPKITDVERMKQSLGPYSDRQNITLTAKENNVAISADGVKVAKTGWAIAEFTAELGNIYLFNPGETSSDVCVFAEYIDKMETRAIDYAYMYDESGRVLTAKATYNGKTYTYTYDYSSSITSIIDQDGNNVSYLPSVYTTTVGTYQPMTILNENAELPEDGYFRFVSNFTTASTIKIVVSYKIQSADMTMKVVRDGSTANMCTQLAKINKKVDEVSGRFIDAWLDICSDKDISIIINGQIRQLSAHKNYIFQNPYDVRFINSSSNLSSIKRFTYHYLYRRLKVYKVHFCAFNGKGMEGLRITYIDVSGWDTSELTELGDAFTACINMDNLDVSGWDTSNITSFSRTFAYCYALSSLNVSGWDMSKVTVLGGMFNACSNLSNLTFGENFGKMKDSCRTLDLSSLSNLTNDSVKSLLTLYDRKANGMGVITIKLHAKAKELLGEDGIAQLTAKGYTIA